MDRDALLSVVVGGIHATIRERVAQGGAEELPLLLPALTYAATAPFLGPREAGRVARAAGTDDGPATTAPCAPGPA
ncbi:hypothetical protein V2I01_00445 [Micromonospora sp. BRA006-A]|nr:hypothetical protein [Micromonospora sp. BRA006-A]